MDVADAAVGDVLYPSIIWSIGSYSSQERCVTAGFEKVTATAIEGGGVSSTADDETVARTSGTGPMVTSLRSNLPVAAPNVGGAGVRCTTLLLIGTGVNGARHAEPLATEAAWACRSAAE